MNYDELIAWLRDASVQTGVPNRYELAADIIEALQRSVEDWKKESELMDAVAKKLERENRDLRSALVHLTQAYRNKHSPQHRANALISAESLLDFEAAP